MRPDVLANRKRNRTARTLYFVRDLGAARGSADHHDAAGRKLIGISVGLGGECCGRRGHVACKRRNVGDVACAGRQHHRAAQPLTLVGAHQIALIGAAQRSDLGVRAYRRSDRLRIVGNKADGLGQGPVTVGIVSGVAKSGQPALPVWRQQPQRIPALGAPRVSNLAALENHVVDRAFGKAAAHGEASVSGPDNDSGDRANLDRPLRRDHVQLDQLSARSAKVGTRSTQLTTTVTLVGLVTMS